MDSDSDGGSDDPYGSEGWSEGEGEEDEDEDNGPVFQNHGDYLFF